MKLKNLQIRCKKMEFSNEFRNVKFVIKPVINFHVGKISDTICSIMCDVKIESDSNNDMPIRLNCLVEGIFEFEEAFNSDEELNEYTKKSGIETVYAYTKSIVASTTAVVGIPAINLPILNFVGTVHNDINAN